MLFPLPPGWREESGWGMRSASHGDLPRIAPHVRRRVAYAVDGAVFPFRRRGWERVGVRIVRRGVVGEEDLAFAVAVVHLEFEPVENLTVWRKLPAFDCEATIGPQQRGTRLQRPTAWQGRGTMGAQIIRPAGRRSISELKKPRELNPRISRGAVEPWSRGAVEPWRFVGNMCWSVWIHFPRASGKVIFQNLHGVTFAPAMGML